MDLGEYLVGGEQQGDRAVVVTIKLVTRFEDWAHDTLNPLLR